MTHLSTLLRRSTLCVLVALSACGGKSESELLAAARSHIEKRDTASASIELKNLLQQNPQSAAGRYLLGKLQFEAGDFEGAQTHLTRALEAGYNDNEVLPLLASALVAAQKTTVLVQQYGSVDLKDDMAAAEFQTQLAAAHMANKTWSSAEQAIDTALRRSSGYPPAALQRARLAAIRGDVPAALGLVDQILAGTPGNARAWAFKGDLLARQRAVTAEPAIEAYRKALGLQPDLLPAHVSLMTLLVEKRQFDAAGEQLTRFKAALPRHPETVYFDGVMALSRGDAKAVRDIAASLLRGPQRDARVLMLAGQAEMLLNSLTQAESLLGKAVQVDPKASAPRRMLVQLYLRTGEADKALALARALAEAQPGDAGLLVLLGRAQLMAGDAKSAEASFGAAGKLRPADKRIPVSAALARLSRGPAGSALEELESLAASDKGTTADMAVISERVRRKDYAGALRAVNALGAKQPDLALPELLRGNIAMLQGNMAAARKGFEGALAKDPGFFQAAALLANLDLAEGKPDAARSRFEALVAHNPRQVNAHMALAQMAARSGAGKATVLRHIEAAIAANPAAPGPRAALVDLHSASGDNALALTAAQNAVAAAPDDVDLLERLGRAQQASGNPNQAVPTFSRIAALRPELAWPHLRLVDMHIASNNMDAASASMRRALEAEPRSPQVLRAGIAMALRSGEAGKARAIARKVQTDQADDAIGYLLEGEIELNQNRPEDAVTVLRKALTKRAPNEAAPRLHQALLMAKKQADAERMAEAWTKAHPEDVAFALHLASSAAQQGDAAQAESRYRAVLKRYPDHVLALNNLAYLLLKQKKPGVVALAEKAVALAPDQPLLMDTLALGYAQENQLPKGLAMQARVVAMAPDVADYRLNLARLHIQAGDTAAARLELGKLAARGKDAPAQEEVARLLKSLGG